MVSIINEPVAWMVKYKGKHDFTFYKPVSHDDAVVIPLYTHQYERPHNTVLVPCDKLAEMQAELDSLRKNINVALIIVNKPKLTDEEMISIYEKDWSGIKCGLGRAVEQAILRKAQEK